MEEDDAQVAKPAPTGGQKKPSYFQPKPPAVVPALIACHPSAPITVVAIGAALRVLDHESHTALPLTDTTSPCRHREAIRAVAFDTSGALFASGGDDKLVKIWDTATWTCRKTLSGPKKISAVAFSSDGRWLCFSDKYGVVYVASTNVDGDPPDVAPGIPKQLLAHCCSIITSLAVSADGRLIASADRDYKLRVSVFPATPLAGAPEIQSFCLGHTSYLTVAFFLPGGLLVSGGGDGTLRLWDPTTGQLLHTLHLLEQQEAEPVASVVARDDAGDAVESSGRAVVAVARSADGNTLAAALEGRSEVVFVDVTNGPPALEVRQRVDLATHAPPTSLAFDTQDRLWTVAGAVQEIETGDMVITPEALAAKEAAAAAAAASAAVQVGLLTWQLRQEAGIGEEAGTELREYAPSVLPGGSVAQEVLEGSQADAAAAGEAAKQAAESMRNLLGKRTYTEGEKKERKRNRNDQKPPRAKS